MIKLLKFILKFFVSVLSLCILIAIVFLSYATLTEYKPAQDEVVKVSSVPETKALKPGSELSALTFNIGYAGLGKDATFFMDGGKGVNPKKDSVNENLNGIIDILKKEQTDIKFVQEVDTDSDRTYHINEVDKITKNFIDKNSAFAYNFKSIFTPYPLPPIGKINSGILTMTDLGVKYADRISLPVPFKWPVRMFNLKRCMLVERIPVGNKELVLVNFHLEAFSTNEARTKQLNEIKSFIASEYKKGNYVMAGGDFNSSFPGANWKKFPGTWEAGSIKQEDFPAGFKLVSDATVPSSRADNHEYVKGDTGLYTIDGFLVSPNITVKSVKTLDLGFKYSDHNPVKMSFKLN